ncbi:thiamine biosynthesis protein ThiS [Arthrobacter sp. RIT-PI-e]|uniref:MoaD/ThiS family protein n=1 Tax=Arthrobacter sp. RIT-PI-e TaxID=1681197 RepID=UPI000675EC26|nr:MoaD/ThiS family protein [Arthrobacter sp. RIT-PI-e]KNC17229.1 thiamine biosynthesis protein ThiS [Arthrobacter sp. RIT-PI-e]
MTSVTVLIPTLLRPCTAGRKEVTLHPDEAHDVAAVLDRLGVLHPLLEGRIRDETGALRRFVNIYVDGEEVRRLDLLGTPVRAGATIMIMQSVAGG